LVSCFRALTHSRRLAHIGVFWVRIHGCHQARSKDFENSWLQKWGVL
jgi:hypothetical protein